MNIKKLFSVITFSLCLGGVMQAQQPYTGCWHPEDIKNWTPENDPSAKFNRSQIPLANRFTEPTLMKANQYQYYEGEICDATILFNMCSQSPSQGANNFTGYCPSYYQYKDKVVYWSGAADEGIICPPPAYSIDACHLNGVKILGQIFLPPTAFGGKDIWAKQLLTQENGTYPYAIKLFEIAKYFGFDGWFINKETMNSGSDLDWCHFIRAFNEAADAEGYTWFECQFYNASLSVNSTVLASHKNTSQFLEYQIATDRRKEYANMLGCSMEETFSRVYAGTQMVGAGLQGAQKFLDGAFPTTGHVGSIALFCPEERIWKDNVSKLLGTSDNCGEKAYAAQEQTFRNEEIMWVNNIGDPSNLTNFDTWRGFSGAILERSNIQSMPFESSMSVGLGKHRFIEGEKIATQDWNNTGVQSILPTWRWWIENRGDLAVSVNWDDAYMLGSSYKITGTLSAGDHLMRLYKTMVPVTDGGTLRVVYKANGGSIEPVVATQSSVTEGQVTLTNPTTITKNGWTVADYNLSPLKGETIYMIALNLKASAAVSDYQALLGQIALYPTSYSPDVVTINNLKVTNSLGMTKGNIRVTWDYTYNNDFEHFDIYITNSKGTKLVGQTRGEGFYIPEVQKSNNETSVKVKVVPVMKRNIQGSGAEVTAAFAVPTNGILLKSDTTYVKVGDNVTITATSMVSNPSWNWTLPSSLELVSGQGTNQIVVKGKSIGQQTVSVTDGTNTISNHNVFAVLSANDIQDIYNVALNKTIHSYSRAYETNLPSYLIDGITNPSGSGEYWFTRGTDFWTVIDLENVYDIYGFRIYDSKSRKGFDGDNILNYRIDLSMDGTTWTTYVDEQDRSEDIKADYISPARARYVRLNPYSDVATKLTLWEFEVYGAPTTKLNVEVPMNLTIAAGTTETIEVTYALNGENRDENFNCIATAGNSVISIGEITEDATKCVFKIPVTAIASIGTSTITVRVNNGEDYRQKTINVTVDNAEQESVLAGMSAEIRYYSTDYSESAQHTTYTVNTLTDGDTSSDVLTVLGDNEFSTHTDDVWAVFEAPETWDLTKVKIYLPNNNQGENANGKQGAVNNEISIRVSDTGTSWTTIKTFSNLTDESQLQYILPESITTKYLAVVCNVNVYFWASLAEVEAFVASSSQLEEVFMPLEISEGFNADIIAERTPVEGCLYANQAVHSNCVYYTKDVSDAGYISDDSRIVNVSNYEYKLGAYDANNSMYASQKDTEYTMTFAEQVSTSELRFLYASAGANVTMRINYTDGTSEETTVENAKTTTLSNKYEYAKIISRIFIKANGTIIPIGLIVENTSGLAEMKIASDINKKVESVTVIPASKTNHFYLAAVYKSYKATGVEDNIAETPANDNTALIVYPNPVRQGEMIKVLTTGTAEVSFVSLTGKVIQQVSAVNEVAEIPVNVPAGVYIVVVKDESGVKTAKVIVK